MDFFKTTVLIYFFIINIAGFLTMYSDKKRAVRHSWRISEKSLFIVAFIGGSIGSLLGMYIFRHKTKHWYFVFFMPLILIFQLIIAFLIIF